MKKSDFLFDDIIAFAGKDHHLQPHVHDPNPLSAPAENLVYYEWNRALGKWIKLQETDPEPDQKNLPNGLFDGQIIEVQL